ncbi:MAG: SDR family oxidoreductase [Nitrospinota bacterium]|nr:SDR family oxidoreductase [Nitrospinota bacterium]
MSERVLVTGGAGFVGSHRCRRLLAEGMEVIAVDNLLTGLRKNLDGITDKGFTFVEKDARESFDWVEGPLDYVLHFASPASPPDYLKYPILTLQTGSIATHQLLELAERKKAVFLLASTSEVYGDPDLHPQREDYWGNVNSIGPRSCYDEAKRYAEAATMAAHRALGVDVRIVRIFNTYGPMMRPEDGRAVTNFLKQAKEGVAITVYGDGTQTRSFCYVSDLVEGILRLMRSSETRPVNLGNPNEITILELAQMVKEHVGSKSEIRFLPLPEDDPKKRRPDISRAKQTLGWEPKVSLKEGLGHTLDYFLSIMS